MPNCSPHNKSDGQLDTKFGRNAGVAAPNLGGNLVSDSLPNHIVGSAKLGIRSDTQSAGTVCEPLCAETDQDPVDKSVDNLWISLWICG